MSFHAVPDGFACRLFLDVLFAIASFLSHNRGADDIMIPLVKSIAFYGFVMVLNFGSGLGCARPTYEAKNFPVEGTARWKDGSDASGLGGQIEFDMNGKVIASTELASDGSFTMAEKLPPGKYRVRVTPGPPTPDQEYVLDARYRKFETSGLSVTVGSEDPQQIVLVMTRTMRTNRS